jgi:predicted RNase H-like nuclease (RuvC/YqgF family)
MTSNQLSAELAETIEIVDADVEWYKAEYLWLDEQVDLLREEVTNLNLDIKQLNKQLTSTHSLMQKLKIDHRNETNKLQETNMNLAQSLSNHLNKIEQLKEELDSAHSVIELFRRGQGSHDN